jgi:hypothetical protein
MPENEFDQMRGEEEKEKGPNNRGRATHDLLNE